MRVMAERSLWSGSSKCRSGRHSEKVRGTWAMVSVRLGSDTMAPGARVLEQQRTSLHGSPSDRSFGRLVGRKRIFGKTANFPI